MNSDFYVCLKKELRVKIIIFCFFFILAGCANPTPKILPDSLHYAAVGKPYLQVINISGGALDEKSTSVIIQPEDSGLHWSPTIGYSYWEGKQSIKEDYHTIVIQGTPLNKGLISISIGGFTYGTMYPGKDFSKVYEITVK